MQLAPRQKMEYKLFSVHAKAIFRGYSLKSKFYDLFKSNNFHDIITVEVKLQKEWKRGKNIKIWIFPLQHRATPRDRQVYFLFVRFVEKKGAMISADCNFLDCLYFYLIVARI